MRLITFIADGNDPLNLQQCCILQSASCPVFGRTCLFVPCVLFKTVSCNHIAREVCTPVFRARLPLRMSTDGSHLPVYVPA